VVTPVRPAVAGAERAHGDYRVERRRCTPAERRHQQRVVAVAARARHARRPRGGVVRQHAGRCRAVRRRGPTRCGRLARAGAPRQQRERERRVEVGAWDDRGADAREPRADAGDDARFLELQRQSRFRAPRRQRKRRVAVARPLTYCVRVCTRLKSKRIQHDVARAVGEQRIERADCRRDLCRRCGVRRCP
jgi:hypothetical protein